MDEKAYTQAIMNILTDGLGFRALKDITLGLENNQHNLNMAVREMSAEKKAIMKICNSDVSNASKLKAVMTLWEN